MQCLRPGRGQLSTKQANAGQGVTPHYHVAPSDAQTVRGPLTQTRSPPHAGRSHFLFPIMSRRDYTTTIVISSFYHDPEKLTAKRPGRGRRTWENSSQRVRTTTSIKKVVLSWGWVPRTSIGPGPPLAERKEGGSPPQACPFPISSSKRETRGVGFPEHAGAGLSLALQGSQAVEGRGPSLRNLPVTSSRNSPGQVGKCNGPPSSLTSAYNS